MDVFNETEMKGGSPTKRGRGASADDLPPPPEIELDFWRLEARELVLWLGTVRRGFGLGI